MYGRCIPSKNLIILHQQLDSKNDAFSPHSYNINSLLQLVLHFFSQNCGQYWWHGCDKDVCDSYHKVMRLTEKAMTEFLLDNYLERNYNKLLKICSPKLPLMFLYHNGRQTQQMFSMSIDQLLVQSTKYSLLSTDAVKPLSPSVSWSITTIGEDPGTAIGSDEIPEGRHSTDEWPCGKRYLCWLAQTITSLLINCNYNNCKYF